MLKTDLLIIGGGINGTGIAADAAGRGLQVVLCEQRDLASATSSKSSKLIHGGLRYLEQYEFRLVHEALEEREVLLRKAPHLIHPLNFVMPHNPQLKPAWMLKIGLFLYDHLSKRKQLPASRGLNFKTHSAGRVLNPKYQKGFMYSDCRVDDARLVVENAVVARDLGATILTHTEFVAATRGADAWQVTLKNAHSGEMQTVAARVLINASGPWVGQVLAQQLKIPSLHHVRLVKGSHIVVPQLYPDDFAFILINSDNRVVFVIPYLEKFHLIGTTDIPFDQDPYAAEISSEEMDYLCTAVNRYFNKSIAATDVIWSYAGVRPLHSEADNEDPSDISRDYALELNVDDHQAPLLSVFGGKITTYRKLAEHTLNELKKFFPHMGAAWTAHAPLPGGDIAPSSFVEFCQQVAEQYPWLPVEVRARYASSYGTRVNKILLGANSVADLGQHFGGGLYAREMQYLREFEWAATAEDILWRRTKLGLFLTTAEVSALEKWLQNN